MKIVDRKTFLAMPSDTVYAKYQPCVFEELSIKSDTIYDGERAIDWFYQPIVDAVDAFDSREWYAFLELSRETGASISMNFEIEDRDGEFDQDQLFAVLEKQDVKALIDRLQRALK